MILHLTIIFGMIAALAAFLLLWYFWVKRKLRASFFLEDEDQVLFPFRYFSWILIGLVVITCVVQIHFLRVSSLAQEKLAAVTFLFENQDACASGVDDLRVMLQTLQGDLRSRLAKLEERPTYHLPRAESVQARQKPDASAEEPKIREPVASRPIHDRAARGLDFGKEATAFTDPSSTKEAAPAPTQKRKKTRKNLWSMRLNLVGRVNAETLNVRKRPNRKAPIMERLKVGTEVKVTEKRMFDDGMWFRIIAPSGRAGWVDFRYLRLHTATRRSSGV
jgi:hypothetical protein